jgi:hypothetical protein
LGISNFGVSKAGALTATGFGFDFGVAAALEVVSAMTVILDLEGAVRVRAVTLDNRPALSRCHRARVSFAARWTE